ETLFVTYVVYGLAIQLSASRGREPGKPDRQTCYRSVWAFRGHRPCRREPQLPPGLAWLPLAREPEARQPGNAVSPWPIPLQRDSARRVACANSASKCLPAQGARQEQIVAAAPAHQSESGQVTHSGGSLETEAVPSASRKGCCRAHKHRSRGQSDRHCR